MPLAFWAWLPPEDAPRPGCTLARGLLRDWFAQCSEAADAYHGGAGLVRLPGFAGWTLLRAGFSAEFAGTLKPFDSQTGSDSRAIVAGPLAPNEIPDPESLVYHAVLPVAESAAAVLALESALKGQKVHFQAVHRNGGFWRVVGKNFRRRAGLYAAWTDAAGALHLLCTDRLVELLGREAPKVLRSPLAAAVLLPDGKCPKCGGERLKTVRARPSSTTPTCPDCGG